MACDAMTYPAQVVGDHTTIASPVCCEELEASGAAMVTDLFRQPGTLRRANRRVEGVFRRQHGARGRRRRHLSASNYAPTRLFAKFTRAFGDLLRELISPVMDP
jgi:hypothetical protein